MQSTFGRLGIKDWSIVGKWEIVETGYSEYDFQTNFPIFGIAQTSFLQDSWLQATKLKQV
jgi:hypothetical protein